MPRRGPVATDTYASSRAANSFCRTSSSSPPHTTPPNERFPNLCGPSSSRPPERSPGWTRAHTCLRLRSVHQPCVLQSRATSWRPRPPRAGSRSTVGAGAHSVAPSATSISHPSSMVVTVMCTGKRPWRMAFEASSSYASSSTSTSPSSMPGGRRRSSMCRRSIDREKVMAAGETTSQRHTSDAVNGARGGAWHAQGVPLMAHAPHLGPDHWSCARHGDLRMSVDQLNPGDCWLLLAVRAPGLGRRTGHGRVRSAVGRSGCARDGRRPRVDVPQLLTSTGLPIGHQPERSRCCTSPPAVSRRPAEPPARHGLDRARLVGTSSRAPRSPGTGRRPRRRPRPRAAVRADPA